MQLVLKMGRLRRLVWGFKTARQEVKHKMINYFRNLIDKI